MKTKMLAVVMAMLPAVVYADEPKTCTASVSPFTAYKGELIADIKIAADYYIRTNDPSAGQTLEERTANLKAHIDKKFVRYSERRTNEYKAVQCTFSAEKTCTNGTHKLKTCGQTLDVPGIYVIETVDKTKNGDLKEFSRNGNTFSFAAGRSSPGKAFAFVRATTRYSDTYIKQQIATEVAALKKDLNDLKIPADF